jgi:orotate phosphoribosyltransferase
MSSLIGLKESMTKDDILNEFKDAGALLEGHFILSSGRRSRVFLQKMFVFQDPARTQKLCEAFATKITARFGKVDYVVSPAVGGIVPGYETARQLGAKAVFVEREEGEFRLRRGFHIPDDARVLMVEDIVTTGLSSRECLASIQGMGILLGAACLIDRSGGRADVGVPLVSLLALDIPDYDANDLPDDLKALPAIKPGSRGLSSGAKP